MNRTYLKVVFGLILLAIWTIMAFGQGVLTNDTLYIGNATGSPGEHIMVPVYIRAHDYYQGWTLPLKFGTGISPLVCDSVSYRGTIMENWVWKSKFVNNRQWDNVQTCGATGVYVWAGDSMLPGYYLALKLYFGIAGSAVPQTITIDTTTCSFAQGGPQNNFIVVVHTQSWRTIVVPGSITVYLAGAEEAGDDRAGPGFNIVPSIVKRGGNVRIRVTGGIMHSCTIRIYDARGGIADFARGGELRRSGEYLYYPIDRLPKGVYFVVVNDEACTPCGKLIVE